MPKLIAIHPGEILRTEFLEPLGISPQLLAQELHVTAPRVDEIVVERRGITAEMAIRLARFFNTTPQLWSNLQAEYDRRLALNALSETALNSIRPFASGARPIATPEDMPGRPRKMARSRSQAEVRDRVRN